MGALVIKEMVLGGRFLFAVITKDMRDEFLVLGRHGLSLELDVEPRKVLAHVAQRLETGRALVCGLEVGCVAELVDAVTARLKTTDASYVSLAILETCVRAVLP